MVRDSYVKYRDGLAIELLACKRKNPWFLTLQLVTFSFFLSLLYVYFFRGFNFFPLFLAAFSFAVYLGMRVLDKHNADEIEILKRTICVFENELKYLDGDFSAFDDGTRYTDPHHAFSTDMDLFGPNSLYHRVNRTITTGGSDMLATLLTVLPVSREEVLRRQESIDELSSLLAARTTFVASAKNKIDTNRTLRLLEETSRLPIGRLFASRLALWTAFALIAILSVTIIFSIFTPLSANCPVTIAILMLMISLMASGKTLHGISKIVNALHKDFFSYSLLLALLDRTEFHAAMNKEIDEKLFSGQVNSGRAFSELDHILSSIDRRGNFIGLILANAFFCSDFFLVRRFVAWQKRYLEYMPMWIDCICRMDAMMSMATYKYNSPDACQAEIVDSENIYYAATGLWHPFIDSARVVRNDFRIDQGRFYIITGANMAGKSTFLRSVGINYILAMNGMPVFARSLKMSMFGLFTSMCTTDDITRGISYFNAELLRLQQLIEACKASTRTLIILDEILKGTNSLDKLNGSRLFLQSISELPVAGVIATHDLELSKMADVDSTHFRNYCFEVELGNEVTYSYRITQGVARNQNATFLLKNILKDIRA